jgi:carboxypeptidase-like protein
MRKFTLLLGLLIFMSFQVVNAQKTITGTVISSEDEMTLPGVSVVVKGTTLGTITDIDGKYSIDVPENATTLVYTYVGMVTEEMAIGANNVIDVSLVPDIMGLDEVVVTALGISERRNLLDMPFKKLEEKTFLVLKTQT